MITFMLFYGFLNFINDIFEFLFHPIRTTINSSAFKLIYSVFVICIGLMIGTLVITIYLGILLFLIAYDLCKYFYKKIKEKNDNKKGTSI